jgi:hypothetical protein
VSSCRLAGEDFTVEAANFYRLEHIEKRFETDIRLPQDALQRAWS